MGDLDINDTTEDAKPQNFKVTTFYVHPNYTLSSHYNDIALLLLDRRARFDDYVKPACLQLTKDIPKAPLIATGWGKVSFFGQASSHLLKVGLNLIKYEDCAENYEQTIGKRLSKGILEETQLCAGHPDGKDTCPVRNFVKLTPSFAMFSI